MTKKTAERRELMPIPKPGILEITPYVGGKGSADERANLAKLSANENALGASPKAIEAYQKAAGGLHRYPDGGSEELRVAIGALHGLDTNRVVCGAGSDELISLIVNAFAGPGDEVLYSEHGFLMYRLSALGAGAHPVAARETGLKADVGALLDKLSSRTKLVFVANPNNPTGSYLSKNELEQLYAGLPADVMLVIDAAYAEFVDSPDYDNGLALAARHHNVIVTRTFSKIYGLAALRLGWMTASPEIIDVIDRIRGPFNVGVPAQMAGLAALEDQEHVQASKRHNDRWRAWLEDQLGRLGYQVYPSAGNFLLLAFDDQPGRDAAAAAAWLEEGGVIPRGMRAYGLPSCLRITVGNEAENQRVVSLLREFREKR